MPARKRQILLTNDDGIQSPGLWAAAEALSTLGFVTVVAPRDQSSGSGRSLPNTSDGIIRRLKVRVHDQTWTVHSVGGTPAQAVLHGVLEVMPRKPDLVVSGVNYGENLGTGVTISGTVGAALEGAALGVPSLAISLETENRYHLTYSTEVDFSATGYFVVLFSRMLLEKQMPPDVDVLKVDIPNNATPDTPWELTRQARHRYYESLAPARASWEDPAVIPYQRAADIHTVPSGTDVDTLLVKRVVSVTPLSLDLSSRVSFDQLDPLLRQQEKIEPQSRKER
jgi:5'-nucleotidase